MLLKQLIWGDGKHWCNEQILSTEGFELALALEVWFIFGAYNVIIYSCWHDIGCTADKHNIWGQIQSPQWRGRGLPMRGILGWLVPLSTDHSLTHSEAGIHLRIHLRMYLLPCSAASPPQRPLRAEASLADWWGSDRGSRWTKGEQRRRRQDPQIAIAA